MPLIGAGKHHVRVQSHQLGQSTNGTPRISVRFESEDVIGDSITWDGYLTDAALARTIESLRVLGWEPEKHDGRIDSLHGTDLLVGAECEIVVEMEQWDGKDRPKVRWINPLGGGGMGEGLGASDAVDLAAQLRQKILSAPRPQASTGPGPSRAPAAAAANGAKKPNNDGLPF